MDGKKQRARRQTPEPERARLEDNAQAGKKLQQAGVRNERRLKKSSKPSRGVTGDEEAFSVKDRDRGPVGTRGRGKPGQSKPGRR